MRQQWDAAAMVALCTRLNGADPAAKPLTHRAARELVVRGALTGGGLDVMYLPDALMSRDAIARLYGLLDGRREAERLIERYAERGVRALVPSDADWPYRLRRLGEMEPAFLFCLGDASLLNRDAVAAAGSRAIGREAQAKAVLLGRAVACHGDVLVSGCAQGVDQRCQAAALAAGGAVVGIPAVRMAEALRNDASRAALDEGRLALLSETLPDEPFSAAKALSRNHLIYAMGSPAVVVAARAGRGGSWHGARDCLAGGWSRVAALQGIDEDFAGCLQLALRGAEAIDAADEETLWRRLMEIRRRDAQETAQQLSIPV